MPAFTTAIAVPTFCLPITAERQALLACGPS